ncbi:MAG: gephyrin-like molybdotransferase Glp [Acidobacteriota bacterium]|nr:gephyrin-like molybdotransferase Glp [Acidobacteriota bacterium]
MTNDDKSSREMRLFGELTAFGFAIDTALKLCEPIIDTEDIPVAGSTGRVIAKAVTAPVDVPVTDRAAMDGYAVITGDLPNSRKDECPIQLEVLGKLLAGDLGTPVVQSGQCLEVATGSQLPVGADAVLPVEQTTCDGAQLTVLASVNQGDHVSVRGEDLREGDLIVGKDSLGSPSVAAALASIGASSITVRRKPRVLLVPNGDELVPLGEKIEPGQVYDSNSVALQALLESNGAIVSRTPIVRDNPAALIEGVRADDIDLVVTLGGTSVGRHDLVVDVVEQMGEVLIHGVAIKPGKPVLVGRVGRVPILGLPGFPTSCLFTGYLFAEPMVRVLAGLPLNHRACAAVRMVTEVNSPPGKRQFVSVQVNGKQAIPVYRASSTITSMSRANGWIEIPEETTKLAAGEQVEVTFF